MMPPGGAPEADLRDDAALARCIADAAGQLLLCVRNSGLFTGRSLGQVGDRVANAFIMEALKAARPEDAVLSEEEKDDPVRLTRSRVWIVDPLDGTREYGEGRDDWAVHVALAIDGQPLVGAVAVPGLAATFCTARPSAIFPADNRKLRMLVSRSRPGADAVRVAERLAADLVPMGSAGAKAMAVLRNEADIYLHSGGQYEWDSCAPIAVARAAGFHTSRADGSPLVYNSADVSLPDLLICRNEHAASVLRAVAELADAPG